MNAIVFQLPNQPVWASFGTRESAERDARILFWYYGATFAATVTGDGRNVERIRRAWEVH
jgi:hypothetical protein